MLASEKARMVAGHDSDIITYNRELLARLCYCALVNTKLNNRVMRLLAPRATRAHELSPPARRRRPSTGFRLVRSRGSVTKGAHE